VGKRGQVTLREKSFTPASMRESLTLVFHSLTPVFQSHSSASHGVFRCVTMFPSVSLSPCMKHYNTLPALQRDG
jgi:hypothetical protein